MPHNNPMETPEKQAYSETNMEWRVKELEGQYKRFLEALSEHSEKDENMFRDISKELVQQDKTATKNHNELSEKVTATTVKLGMYGTLAGAVFTFILWYLGGKH